MIMRLVKSWMLLIRFLLAISLWGNLMLLTHPDRWVAAAALILAVGLAGAYYFFVTRRSARRVQNMLNQVTPQDFSALMEKFMKE